MVQITTDDQLEARLRRDREISTTIVSALPRDPFTLGSRVSGTLFLAQIADDDPDPSCVEWNKGYAAGIVRAIASLANVTSAEVRDYIDELREMGR